MSQPTPPSKEKLRLLWRLNLILDKYVLPYPVMFLTNRIVILATLGILIPLIFFNNDQSFVNTTNSYLNVMSVVVSSTVLLYATIADVRDRAAAKRADDMAKTYEQMLENRIRGREALDKAYEQVLEKRVQAEHELIQQILQNSIENMLGGRLEKIRIEDHQQLEEMRKAVIVSNEALRAELLEKAVTANNDLVHSELAELRVLVKELHRAVHTGKDDVQE